MRLFYLEHQQQRDREMHQTKKGRPVVAWHASHIGIDARSGLAHTIARLSRFPVDVSKL